MSFLIIYWIYLEVCEWFRVTVEVEVRRLCVRLCERVSMLLDR